jgi:hypothetical protein
LITAAQGQGLYVSTETFYATVTFVRDPQNELKALKPAPMPTLYRALREAANSVGALTDDGLIVGAVVFSRDIDAGGNSKRIKVIARFGDTPVGD